MIQILTKKQREMYLVEILLTKNSMGNSIQQILSLKIERDLFLFTRLRKNQKHPTLIYLLTFLGSAKRNSQINSIPSKD